MIRTLPAETIVYSATFPVQSAQPTGDGDGEFFDYPLSAGNPSLADKSAVKQGKSSGEAVQVACDDSHAPSLERQWTQVKENCNFYVPEWNGKACENCNYY